MCIYLVRVQHPVRADYVHVRWRYIVLLLLLMLLEEHLQGCFVSPVDQFAHQPTHGRRQDGLKLAVQRFGLVAFRHNQPTAIRGHKTGSVLDLQQDPIDRVSRVLPGH